MPTRSVVKAPAKATRDHARGARRGSTAPAIVRTSASFASGRAERRRASRRRSLLRRLRASHMRIDLPLIVDGLLGHIPLRSPKTLRRPFEPLLSAGMERPLLMGVEVPRDGATLRRSRRRSTCDLTAS